MTKVDSYVTVSASTDDDGLVLLDTNRGCLFVANRIGARLWHGVTRAALDDVVRSISEEFGVPFETASADAAQFLAELKRQHLIDGCQGVAR